MNANQALWEKGDFTRIAESMRESGEAVVQGQLGRERKAAVIAVTHDERMLEGFDRVYHMIDGRIDRSWRPSGAASDGA